MMKENPEGSLKLRSCGIRLPVSRCLFGRVDHDQNRKDLRRQLQKIEEDKRQKWNFNFKEGRPLEGPYEWKPVDGLTAETAQNLDLSGGVSRRSTVFMCSAFESFIGSATTVSYNDPVFSSISTEATSDGVLSPRFSPSLFSSSSENATTAVDPPLAPGTSLSATSRIKRQTTLDRFYRVKKRRTDK